MTDLYFVEGKVIPRRYNGEKPEMDKYLSELREETEREARYLTNLL
jgi:hypothetical protein